MAAINILNILRIWHQKKYSGYVIGFSGGLDSQVLLHALAQLRDELKINLQAVHVNHQISSNANMWQQHCAQVCLSLKIPFKTSVVVIPKNKNSLEENARQLRYAELLRCADLNNPLLTAHHQDDQVETVLQRLLAGSGPCGLQGIHAEMDFSEGKVLRPLLSCARENILDYALQNNLTWIEDESNSDLKFNRNYLRQEIIPKLKIVWPGLNATVSRSAIHCQTTEKLLQQYVLNDYNDLLNADNSLVVSKLLNYNLVKQAEIIRMHLHNNKFQMPSTVKLQQILTSVLLAKPDAMPCVELSDCEVRRYRDKLYFILPLIPFDNTQVFIWNTSASLIIAGIGKICATDYPQITLPKIVKVFFRQGGEVILHNGKHKSLKNYFQEQGVVPWLRDRVPLLAFDDCVVCNALIVL